MARLVTNYEVLMALNPVDKTAALVTSQAGASDNVYGEPDLVTGIDQGLMRKLVDDVVELTGRIIQMDLDGTPELTRKLRRERAALKRRIFDVSAGRHYKSIADLQMGDRFVVVETLTQKPLYEDVIGWRNGEHVRGVAQPKRTFLRKNGLFFGKSDKYGQKEMQARHAKF